MQVTNIQVSFLREKQPTKFEKARPAVEFTAVLEDGEDHMVAARSLMMDAAGVVYAGIGYDVPARIVTALATGKAPPEATVKTETEEAAPEAAEAPEAPKAHEVAEAPKRKRGRPAGSKNTQPKKGSQAAADQAAAGKAATAEAKSDDGLPPEDTDTRQVSTNPENRVGPEDGLPPEDGATELPTAPQDEGDASMETAEFNAKDLHDMIISAVQKKELSVQNAKQVLVHFKVARAQDLTNEQALKGKGMVEDMLAASK